MSQGSHIFARTNRLKAQVSIAAVISETLRLSRNGPHLMALCPFHDEKTPSFCIYDDHYYCFGCGSHGDVLTWLLKSRRMTFAEGVRYLARFAPSDRTQHHPLPKPMPMRGALSPTANQFLAWWDHGVDPVGTIVEIYLRSRGGLKIPDGAPIRFHPCCQRGGRNLPGGPEHWPAMLALMTHPITGQAVGVHRTYLRPDGSAKAPVTERGGTVLTSKRILGTWGVIRLAPDADVGRALGVAEGLENALTASQTIGWGPVWAAGTQNELARLPLLPAIEALTIFADADDSGVGMAAAHTCADRWEAAGREARIYRPPAGKDWNDAARRLPHESA